MDHNYTHYLEQCLSLAETLRQHLGESKKYNNLPP